MNKRIKSTKVVKEQRVKQVTDLLNMGKYRWEIISILSKEWQCSERNVIKYVEAATKLITQHFSQENVDSILAKYNMLYNDAMEKGDKRFATKILDSISKLGTYNKQTIELTGELSIRDIQVTIKTNEDK